MKEKNFGFLLKRNEYETVGFRFFPEHSHVHGFGGECPKTWDEVYKVYCVWSIYITKYGERSTFDVWDEGSVLGSVADVITQFAAADKNDSTSFGDGADWDIRYFSNPEADLLRFHSACGTTAAASAFLRREKTLCVSPRIQSYMIKHSEPI